MRKLYQSGLVWLLLSCVLLALDRYSKVWMLSHLSLGEPVALSSFLNLTLAYNTGAAFSFLNSAGGWQQYFLGGLAMTVAVFILGCLYKLPRDDYWQNAALSMIFAGAVGNAWDRVDYGHVIDFINLHIGDWHFAIFNVADSAISAGAMMLILLWLRPQAK